MNILAIETSSEACSCALMLADGSLAQRYELAPRQHTQLLLPMVNELLSDAQMALGAVDCFAFGCGPGSFTGVRIATSAIQGLAVAVERPVLAVSSLAALAAGSEKGSNRVLAVFDARMGEVYLGAFELDTSALPTACQAESLAAPDLVELPASGDWSGVGGGWSVHGEVLAGRLGTRLLNVDGDRLPEAQHVARLAQGPARAGEAVEAEHALPNYMRRQVAAPRGAT